MGHDTVTVVSSNAVDDVDSLGFRRWLREEVLARRERRDEALQNRDGLVCVRNPDGAFHVGDRRSEYVILEAFLLRDP